MLFLLLKTTALQCTENQLFFYTIIMWTSWTGTFFFLVEISERKLLEWPISWTHFEFFRVGANQKSPLKTTDLQKVAYKLYHIILYQVHLAMSGIQTHDFIFEALILWYEISAIRFVSMGTIFTRFIEVNVWIYWLLRGKMIFTETKFFFYKSQLIHTFTESKDNNCFILYFE